MLLEEVGHLQRKEGLVNGSDAGVEDQEKEILRVDSYNHDASAH
jgi:hypothetical protein